jgi:hypothetical protein
VWWRHYARPLVVPGDFQSSPLKRAVLAVSALFFQQTLTVGATRSRKCAFLGQRRAEQLAHDSDDPDCLPRQQRAGRLLYFEKEPPGGCAAAKLLTRDEARRIAANIAKLSASCAVRRR